MYVYSHWWKASFDMREEKYIKRGVPNGVSFFLKSNEYYWLIQTFTDIIGHEDLYTSWMWGN